MNMQVQLMLEAKPYLKKYLREHSHYYKNLIRDPRFIKNIEELMKKDYGLTLPNKLEKIKDNIAMVNAFMDVLK